MDMNSIMASQLRSLQSTVQMSVLNNALSMEHCSGNRYVEKFT